MSQVVDFQTVSTAGLESSPVPDALAGLRANEARYYKNKYDHDFTVTPAEDAPDVGVVGFDCSGLTRYAYAQAGIAIPRVAADQFAVLPKVTHLRPGDLAFYATDPNDPSTIHHVVMYLGKGQIIEAPESGERVHVTSMRYGYEYIGAVRPSG